jgi:hypothetical protein
MAGMERGDVGSTTQPKAQQEEDASLLWVASGGSAVVGAP